MLKLIPIILLFVSCGTIKHYQYVANDESFSPKELTLLAKASSRAFPPKVVYIKGQDSTIYKDSVIIIPGETLIDTFPCPDIEYHSHVQGNNTSLKVNISKGKGSIECKADSLLKVLDSVIREHRRVDTVKETDTVNAFLYKQAQARVDQYKSDEKRLGYILGLIGKWLIRKWWFWVAVVLFGLYIFRGSWITKILDGLRSFFFSFWQR